MPSLIEPRSSQLTPGPLASDVREKFIKKLARVVGNETAAITLVQRIERVRELEIAETKPPAIIELFERTFAVIDAAERIESETRLHFGKETLTPRTQETINTIKTAQRYKDAIGGKALIGEKTIAKKLGRPYFDDLLNLYALSGSTNLGNVFNSATKLAVTNPEAARELLTHLVPITARLQPNILLNAAPMLLRKPEEMPLFDLELAKFYLIDAAKHAPDKVGTAIGKSSFHAIGEKPVTRVQEGRPLDQQIKQREARANDLQSINAQLDTMDASDPTRDDLLDKQERAALAVIIHAENEAFLNELIEIAQAATAKDKSAVWR